MGARNVAAAFAMWGHLDHGPFRLLVGMALIALDAPTKEGRPARVYFGGEQGLRDLYGRPGNAAYNALSALRKAGAVTVLVGGRNGHRASYKLNLDAFEGGGEASRDVTLGADQDPGPSLTSDEAEASRDVTEASRDVTEASRDVTPRKDEEVTRRSRGGDTSSPSATTEGATTVGAKTDSPLDYDTAYQIVQAALGIEAASARIVELTVAGTDYETAMATLAQEVQSGKAGKR